ncbi:MAG: carboxypeptidase-like regulatory domain-containing protein, partial [Candidatus Cloacimonadaceae bacterium]|nr:carboxypeptidase-like regulatory domain-containing protein [Candidatus Cloacimonadaceae bacterium]
MKALFLVMVLLAMCLCLVWAKPVLPAPANPREMFLSSDTMPDRTQPERVPNWSFETVPVSIMTSYWDYMIGSYDTTPLRAIPQNFGGGYFLTFTGQRQPTSQRRVFFSHISDGGVVWTNTEITNYVNREGYSALAVDPISGKPFYSWHSNADADAELEVICTSDAFLDGISGLFNDPQVVINNPITITAPNGTTTTNNEFIWPQMAIGPSPVANRRRLYILGRNAVSHAGSPVENPYIAYADVNGDMVEMGTPLTWTYISVPVLNAWSHDALLWRRPFYTMAVDNGGKIILMGYHVSNDASLANEPDIDVFVCDNYGQGTWQHHSFHSKIPSWNPPTNYGNGPGLITLNGTPLADEDIYWQIVNSNHRNVEVDNYGRVHSPGLWALQLSNGTYYPEYNVIKDFIFDPATNTLSIVPVYPNVAGYQPWDTNGDGIVDSYDTTGNPILQRDWNYPHWDSSLNDSAMQFHYNHLKITKPNTHGHMAVVWQNCSRAREFHQYGNPAYAAYANVPEIFVAVSPNSGYGWYDPIKINSVETAGFSDNRPMWVYPADLITGGVDTGKLAMMYYNDYTWGSYSIAPPAHPVNDGGAVKFMALNISFSPPIASGISGYVVDANTNAPVHGATVQIGNHSQTTMVNGYYSITLEAGSYTMTVSKQGYFSQTIQNIQVNENQYSYQNVSLVPLPVISVMGVVKNAGAECFIQGAQVRLTGTVQYTASTNTSGGFSLAGVYANEPYELEISKPGYETLLAQYNFGESDMNLGVLLLAEIINVPSITVHTIAPDNDSFILSWTTPRQQRHSQHESGNRDVTGFDIWRFAWENVDNPDEWLHLSYLPATNFSYQDFGWAALLEGTYGYAVKAIYSGEI